MGGRRGNADFEFRAAKCGLLGTDLAAFPDYAHRAARSIHPRVGSRGSAAALRCNTRRSVAWSPIQAARARSHSRSPFGTRRSASGESRHEYERPFCRHYSALPDLPFANGQTESASRIASRSGILGLPELSRLPRHATGLTEVRSQRSEVRRQSPRHGESVHRRTRRLRPLAKRSEVGGQRTERGKRKRRPIAARSA
jgi:hypothetical protein